MGPMSAWTEATLGRMTLTQRMLERLDVDTTKVVCADFGMTFRSVVGRCRACGDEEVCSRWLDGEETGSDPSRFCPNSRTFGSYRQQ